MRAADIHVGHAYYGRDHKNGRTPVRVVIGEGEPRWPNQRDRDCVTWVDDVTGKRGIMTRKRFADWAGSMVGGGFLLVLLAVAVGS